MSLDGRTIRLTQGELLITSSVTIDAMSLPRGLTIDAPGNDQAPSQNNGDGSRVMHIHRQRHAMSMEVGLRGLALPGGDSSFLGGRILAQSSRVTTGEPLALMIDSCAISNNAALFGGGIYSTLGHGTVTITSSTISGNLAADGGGIFVSGRYTQVVTISSSAISGNAATGPRGVNDDGGGGGISANGCFQHCNPTDKQTMTVATSTITGNSAGRIGGGIFGWIDLYNSILAANKAPFGAGITSRIGIFSNWSGSVRNSLVGDGSQLKLSEAPIGHPDADDNLIGDPRGKGIIAPLLGPLADNGARTYTHAIVSGNPAIDAGDPTFSKPHEFDQRGEGYNRVINGRIDIGALEQTPVILMATARSMPLTRACCCTIGQLITRLLTYRKMESSMPSTRES